MDGKQISQCFIDEIKDVLDKYNGIGLTYCEAIGCLEILSRDIYQTMLDDDDDEITP